MQKISPIFAPIEEFEMSLLACSALCKSPSSESSNWNKLVKRKLLKGDVEQAIVTVFKDAGTWYS